MQKQYPKGFTLIEILLVVTIIGVIMAFAYPAYVDTVKKTHRADAKSALVNFSGAMESYFTENNTFLGAAGTKTSSTNEGSPWIFPTEAPIDSATKYYDLMIGNADTATTATSFTLYAVPKGGQVGDGRLALDSDGGRVWNSRDDGSGDDTEW